MSKKLSLNKNTVANLGVKVVEMDDVYGGGTYRPLLCPTPDSAICMVSHFEDCDTDNNSCVGGTCDPISCNAGGCY